MRFITLVISCLTLLLFPAPIFAHSDDDEVIIHMSEAGFEPKDISIEAGETVTFENVGTTNIWPASNIHPTHRSYPNTDIKNCFTEKKNQNFDACQGIKPGDTYSFTFNHVGVWRYHDHIDSSLTGSITVTDSGTSQTSASPITTITEPQAQKKGVLPTLQRFWKKTVAFVTGKPLTPPSQPVVATSVAASEKSALSHTYNDQIAEDSPTLFTNEADLYSYVKKYGPAKTVQHLNVLSSTNGSCHDIAHEAGRFAYEIFGEKAFQTCSAECHSGCYHGATESYFREHGTANLEENLQLICNTELNPFFSHQCIHGVGHGLMAWYDYEIHDALKACDTLRDGRSSCYSGVFMENVVGGLAEEHKSRYLSEDPHYPCDVVDKKYQSSCYFYQSSRALQLFGQDWEKIANFCEEAAEGYQQNCYSSMGRDAGGMNRHRPEDAIAACNVIPDPKDRTICFGGAVQDYFWDPTGQDDAAKFCRLLTENSDKKICYTVIVNRGPQVIDNKKEMDGFCGKLEKNYQDYCKSISTAAFNQDEK